MDVNSLEASTVWRPERAPDAGVPPGMGFALPVGDDHPFMDDFSAPALTGINSRLPPGGQL